MKPPRQIEKPLGQILVERGIVTRPQLEKALEIQKKEGGLIGEVLVKLGFTTEESIAHCLSLQFGFPYLPLENYEVSKEFVCLIPKNVAAHYCLIAIDKIGSTLTIAIANPLNIQAIEDLEDLTHCEIQIFVSTPSDIRKSIEKFY